jgi:hypothetical protein
VSKVIVSSIPCPSTEIVGEPEMRVAGADLALSFVFEDDDDSRFVARVEFSGVRAFRKRAESFCTVWHVEDAYDTVVEVLDSVWISELASDLSDRWKGRFPMRHFLLYLDSFGALEVIGARVEMIPPTPLK